MMKAKGKKFRLVNVSKYGFTAEPRYYFFGWTKTEKILAREQAIKALIKAKRLLPKGYNFKVWDCLRPRYVQLAMVGSFEKRLRTIYPGLSKKKLEALVKRFSGQTPPPLRVDRLDTHRNGGAFDLTIINRNGVELYMGTDHDDLTERAATDYFDKISRPTSFDRIVRSNRRLLQKVMKRAGFKNYEAEWWHWSYSE